MVRGRPKRGRQGAACRPPSGIRRGRGPGPRRGPFDEVILHLRHVQSIVIVAVAALRHQNCGLDEDIARLLQRCVSDRIDSQAEKLEAARHPRAARMRRI